MPDRPRRILYFGPLEGGDPLGIARVAPARRTPEGAIVYELGESRREVFASDDARWCFSFLERKAVDLLVLETRKRPPAMGGANPTGDARELDALLETLFPEGGIHAGIQRDRILALVAPDGRGADRAYRLGMLGIGTVLCDPSWEALHEGIDSILRERTGGQVAVCLAGGGVEGLFYELGVLRALDAFLVNRRVEDLDLFCGISAGAVITAFMANGISPDEIARAFAGGSARVDAIRKRELFDPNVRELGERAAKLAREALRGGVGPRGLLSSLSRSLPSGAFAGDGLRAYLRRHLNQPGMSDRFADLRRPLFIGATNMDTSEAVVFGEPGWDHVPVHKAVRASAALAPFYAPEPIEGRWYIDGAFTRTTNMRVAVRQGATMVILVDPLVPVHSDEPGYVRERGGLFVGMQGLKSIINGRFDKAVRAIREMNPQVSFYLFRPHADEMRVLSGSPMKYFYRREVENIAFKTSMEKIRGAFSDLRRDFARHGIVFRDPDGEPASAMSRFDASMELTL